MTKKTAKPQAEAKPAAKKKVARAIQGTVVSSKMAKTIVVQGMRLVKHKLYGKYLRHYSKMYVHDEANQCHEGDVVKIKQTRPISKSKRWMLTEIVRRADHSLADAGSKEANNAA
jgi:small subunit ribosomal protein S17